MEHIDQQKNLRRKPSRSAGEEPVTVLANAALES